MAIDAVRRYGDVVSENLELKTNPGLAKLRATLLKEPQAFFKRLRDRLQADRETSPESLARLADANLVLGSITNEIGDKEDAVPHLRGVAGDPAETGKRSSLSPCLPARPGAKPCQHRCHTEYDRPAGPGSCGVRARPRDP